MSLKPWDEIAPEPLAFPIGGRTYVVPEMSMKTGLHLEATLKDPKALQDLKNMDLWRMCLGDVFDEMVEGGAPGPAIERAGMAAYTDWRSGRAAAEAIWESGVSPEALAAAAAKQTKTPTKKASTRSTGTAAAAKTRSRASTSGTRTSRRK